MCFEAPVSQSSTICGDAWLALASAAADHSSEENVTLEVALADDDLSLSSDFLSLESELELADDFFCLAEGHLFDL